ncbi:C-type mannose receptor 2-like isoform X1 [Zerene cesonia]|uniref:C-type mannose receptor 2-like isoform X1 n=1 Tax=Zerene cesonia TaxID=33412 RepID=UPI0018E55E39|nr:C-type mannose receptor 2-like isoform X1 [Zerene cesonia]
MSVTVLKSLIGFMCIYLADSITFRYDYEFSKEASGWIKHHQVPATWPEARLRCHLEGAILLSPKTANLQEVMKKTMKDTHSERTGVFTGIHALFSKGDFHSVDGVPLNKMPLKWMPFEPDNLGNDERCIAMVANGTIADVNCFDVFPYICFRDKTQHVPLTDCGTVDREYILDNRTGKCYKFHWVARNWTSAFMTCAAEGGHLAIINSEVEATVLADLAQKYPPKKMLFTRYRHLALLGFNDWSDNIVWTTVEGQTLQEAGYYQFEEHQPDEYPLKCGGMFRNGKLDDLWCDTQVPLICEKNFDSLL